MRVLTKKEFFEGAVPAGLPEDSPNPHFEKLLARASELGADSYDLGRFLHLLIRENRNLGASQESLNLLPTAEDHPLFVVAGQQAGLFGGPLYTFYKALHAIRLAARLRDALGKRVVPLFWVASDDHDFTEVSHLRVRTGDGSKGTVGYTPSGWLQGMPVGDIVLDEGINAALDSLAAHVPKSEAGERYLALLRECWRPGEKWTDAFIRQMSKLLSQHGLILFDPRWPEAKSLFSPMLRAGLEQPLASTALVNAQANEQSTARARKEAIRKASDATNLFLETGGIRHPVRFEGNEFIAGDERFQRERMLALAESEPERFSPGAALRPVFQDWLMPVMATIAGPGERVYLSQIEQVYRVFKVSRSLSWPRASFTVADRRVLRYAEQEGIELRRLFGDFDEVMSRISRDTLPEPVSLAFDSLRDGISGGFNRLESEISGIDPTLAQSANRDRGRMLHILEEIRGRILKAHRASRKTTERRIASAVSFLMPEGRPQERWYGIDAILPVLDEAGLPAFIELTSPGEHLHRIIIPPSPA